MRAAVFLALLYFTLFAVHAWVAVASRYENYSCVFCFTPYLTFFDPLGILLLAIAFSTSWKQKPASRIIQILIVLFILVLSSGIGFSMFENVGREILYLSVPREPDGRTMADKVALVNMLTYRYGVDVPTVKKAISSGLGLLTGLLTLLFAFTFWLGTRKRHGYVYILINVYLILGIFLSPLLNIGENRIDCDQNLIIANERLGAYLSQIIPPHSLVYWDGGLSFTPMVYVADARIFPPQINGDYTYRIGGDAETLYRQSYWNEELKLQWMNSADVFIIENERYPSWKEFLSPQAFEEYAEPLTAPSCKKGAGLRIFHRLY